MFEEFASGKDVSAKMLNGKAVCMILLMRFAEAESVLLDTLKIVMR